MSNEAESRRRELGARKPDVSNKVLFTHRDLIEFYSKNIANRVRGIEETALMNRSLFLRDVYVFSATQQTHDAKDFYDLLVTDQIHNAKLDFEALNALGRLIAFQNDGPTDLDFALRCLSLSTEKVALRSTKIENIKLRVELHAERREYAEAIKLLEDYSDLLGETHQFLMTDLNNPFKNTNGWSVEQWLQGFNEPFVTCGMAPIQINTTQASCAFDALSCVPNHEVITGPLVSVVMTSYAPDEAAFELAIKSILQQSWRNLELIVVDDATPGGPPSILSELAQSDPRLQVIMLEENRGTYYARNVGLRAAQGAYVTGQDSDDWSHPDRIYHQMQALMNAPESIGVVGMAIRTDDDLYRVLPGIAPYRMCEVSLLYPRDAALQIGGYLESRKGADSEFRMRLEQFTKRPVERLQHPVYLTRLSSGSLSRGEFKVGWAHPNRRAFLNFMRHWHENASTAELVLPKEQNEQPGLPQKFHSRGGRTREFDYVYVSDWRHNDETTRGALEEVHALRSAGNRVGIAQLNGVFPDKAPASKILPSLQEQINDRRLEFVVPDEGALISTLVIRSAELLQFAPHDGFDNAIGRIVVFANRAPSAWDGGDPHYNPLDCSRRAVELFGQEPVWVTQDPAIADYFRTYFSDINLWYEILPFVSPRARPIINQETTRLEDAVPTVGRTANNIRLSWPSQLTTVSKLWPLEGSSVNVQILGSMGCYRDKFGKHAVSGNWSVYKNLVSVGPVFFSGLDYYVYFPDERLPQTFTYDALVAHAQGATVILPKRFSPLHNGRAVFLDPDDVQDFISWDWQTGGVLGRSESEIGRDKKAEGQDFVRMLADIRC